MLPAWYGFGSAVAELCRQEGRLNDLQQHARHNPFFSGHVVKHGASDGQNRHHPLAEEYAGLSQSPSKPPPFSP